MDKVFERERDKRSQRKCQLHNYGPVFSQFLGPHRGNAEYSYDEVHLFSSRLWMHCVYALQVDALQRKEEVEEVGDVGAFIRNGEELS